MPNKISGARFVDEDGEVHTIVWKTPHNHDTEAESERTATLCEEPTKTQQHFKEEADINTIVERFMKTGALPQLQMTPNYGMFDQEFDFQDAQNRIAETNGMFYKLPAAIRSSYNNDPAAWRNDVLARYNAGDYKPLEEMGLQLPTAHQEPPPNQGTPPANPAPETLKPPSEGGKT